MMNENMNAAPSAPAAPAASVVTVDAPEIRCYLMIDGNEHETNGIDQFSGGRTGGIPLVSLTDTIARIAAAVSTERERAARLALQWSNARLPDHGGNSLRAYAQALRDGVQVCEDESRDYHWSKSPAAPAAPAGEWANAERICNLPAVHEVIQGFADDRTGDNATMVVREVMRAVAQVTQDSGRDEALHRAVGNLIKAKGRFHSEQNYTAVVSAYDAAVAAQQGEKGGAA